MCSDPTEEARRIAEVFDIDTVAPRDIDANDRAAMHVFQHIDGKVLQHCAIDEQFMIAFNHGRQNARQ